MQPFDVLDVTVTSPASIDMDMFDYWIQGLSISQACSLLSAMPSTEEFGMTNHLLAIHVRDHFAQFTLLEAGFRHPETFLKACMYHQIPPFLRKQLIHKYYSLNEKLLRELVGRKLSNKTHRDLSDIAERCDLRLRSCKRQFGNILSVARRIEDLPGRLADNIRVHFALPNWLAECYAAVVFIATNRFEVQKKNMSYITFDDLAYCAGQLMSQWSSAANDSKSDGGLGVDLDLNFFHELKEFKPLVEKREYLDKHRSLVLRVLGEAHVMKIIPSVEVHFKSISKSIIAIACGLTHAKEMRDFFLDIVEKLVEPMRSLGWPAKEVQLFLQAYSSTVANLPLGKSPNFIPIWTRFIGPFINCAQRLYHT
ncbi:unnamed protein product [Calicophoron daubneyi]|uniref:Acidic fibroblast growth factor intracellular-binding protein n=1 Tax=Calicophoron daubneyi TaxID=300641 RepID=A0AAV2T6T1_CALDB